MALIRGVGAAMAVRSRVFVLWAVLAALLASPAAAWEPREEARVFFFGNSLIHHLTDSDTTAVPHWLALLASHSGKEFAADGRWGFPRNFAADLPPETQWQFEEVERVGPLWSPVQAGLYDTWILNTENFVQGNPPTQLYDGENRERQSPVDATLAVLDWIDASGGTGRFLVYEGWADLYPFAKSFPPDAEAFARYYEYARGTYHDWYPAFARALRDARPGREIALIPVGRLIAEVIAMPELSGLAPDDLYSDLSPHGTATTYLLAAMITYAALYGERPPAGFPVPDVIAPDFARNYEGVADLVWREMQGADLR